MDNLNGNDVYLRITNKRGESHVQHHRVWDAKKFISSMQKQHSEQKNPEDNCKVEIATKSDYDKGRK